MDPVTEHELLTPYDIHLFKEGKHFKLHEKLGSHPTHLDGREGTQFAVWAPSAKHVSVIGDFNEWRSGLHPLSLRKDDSGIWEGFIAGPTRGSLYKYHVESKAHLGYSMDKGDPFALHWEVPSHFPSDAYGLAYYDGSHLFEYADPKKGYHPDWKSYIFDFGKGEVRSFLASSALFWFDAYHTDGLRVDAVASMIYLDYSRKKGEWTPNQYGGRENLEALSFIRDLNQAVYRAHPDVQMIAEESTAWPMVSRPVYLGGLGFGMKWNMGWMHDTLEYMTKEPVYRKHHHNQLTFSLWYAFAENFVLPLSHDEVVYGKRSLLDKMPGDTWEKFANLRLLYGYMYGHPGKKLLFMGGEFGQWDEWDFEKSLDWHLAKEQSHKQLQFWVKDLNAIYAKELALHQLDFERLGFEWLDIQDWEKSIISFSRRAKSPEHSVIVVCNFTPILRKNYRLGVPKRGRWKEILNSDALEYGGSGQGNLGGVDADQHPFHRRKDSMSITLPPLSCLFFRSEN